jgi:hypothetical protein
LTVVLGSHVTSVDSSIRLLGFTLDCNLSFLTHVKQLVCQMNSALFALRKVRTFFTEAECLFVYQCFVRSRLEYCSSVLHCRKTLSISADLERCQSRAIRVICRRPLNAGCSDFSVSEAREELQLEPLENRRVLQFQALIQRVIAGRASSYLLALLNDCEKRERSLRNMCDFVLPSVRSNFGKARFSYVAISALK